MALDILQQLAGELALPAKGIAAVIKLVTEGNTVPFISRYSKEATGNLDEVQIRTIQERYAYLIELEDRKKTILDSIESQGKMTDVLKAQIQACISKNHLEDLYIPYKPKKRTKASIAKEKGLEPLALRIISQPLEGNPYQEASAFIQTEKDMNSPEDALSGALDIVAEILAEKADIRALVREYFEKEGVVVSQVIEGKDSAPTKYELYYNFQEKVSKIPSHRYLAIRRGEKEEILNFHIEVPLEPLLNEMKHIAGHNPKSPFAEELFKGMRQALKRHLSPSVETEIRVQLKMQSDRAAVQVFNANPFANL